MQKGKPRWITPRQSQVLTGKTQQATELVSQPEITS